MNAYLKEFLDAKGGVGITASLSALRTALVQKYAWAIPCDAALDAIKSLNKPILEMGAGTGYWAYLLGEMGVDVLPFDTDPPSTKRNQYRHRKEWVPIARGTPNIIAQHPDRVLMLCWPPYNNSMASDSLYHYTGDTLIFIGEYYGCTGDDQFFAELDRHWTRLPTIQIPNWFGLNDNMFILQRKQ